MAGISSFPSASDLISAAIIAACFVTLIVAAEAWHIARNPPVEWTRKLVHFGGGMTCLTLPFFIQSHWVVLGLAASMAVIFVVSKRNGLLQSIHGVKRKSAGTEFYPVVVYLLFVLCLGAAWKFIICILVLAVSDSAAALVGKRFGQLRFSVEDEYKSVEGSTAFFAVTFAAVFVPLMIWNPIAESSSPIWHYVLAASLIGLLVMCVELISLRGTDNLWVPLGTLLVLTKTMQTDVYDLAIQNVSFLAILVTIIGGSFVSKTFNVGGAIVICLASYGCWAMGSFDWALPVFIGFGVYLIVSYVADSPWRLRVRPVLYNLLPPFLMLGSANIMLNMDQVEAYRFIFLPFLAAVSVALTQGCGNMAGWNHRKHQPTCFAIHLVLAVFVGLILNYPAVHRATIVVWPSLIVLVLVIVGVSLLSCRLVQPLPPGDAPRRWLYLRACLTTLAFFIMVLLQFMNLCVSGIPT